MKSNDCFHDLLHYIKAKQNKTEAKNYTLIVSSLSRRLHATVALHMYYHQSMFKYWLIDMHKYIHTHVYFFKSSQFNTTKLCDHFFVSFISYVFTFCAMNTCIMLQNILDLKAEPLQLHSLGRGETGKRTSWLQLKCQLLPWNEDSTRQKDEKLWLMI